MTNLMQQEMQSVFYMVCNGLSIMFLFYVRDMCMTRWNLRKNTARLVYLLGWVLAAFLFWEYVYLGSYGVLSWYGLAAFAIGIMLWKRGICVILRLDVNEYKPGGEIKDEKKNKRANQTIRREE